jgi:uncharacterized protein YukE
LRPFGEDVFTQTVTTKDAATNQQGETQMPATFANPGGAGFLGSDPEKLKTFSGQMMTEAAKLDEVVNIINRKITETPWSGDDARRFSDDWTNFEKQMKSMVTHFHDVSKQLTNEATEQRTASGGSGSPTS